MIRPIDTQILYAQSVELANRQQVTNQSAVVQQNQFAEIVQKEVQTKKEQVQQTSEDEKVKNEKEKSNKEKYSKQEKKKKERKEDEIVKRVEERALKENKRQIDIKI